MTTLNLILFGIFMYLSFQNVISQEELGDVELGCRTGTYRNGNCCYDLNTDVRVTYDEAQLNCRKQGGSLAIIKDYENHKFLHRLHAMKTLHNYWFGLSDIEHEGKWIFEDGTELLNHSYTNWGVGEPNNHKGKENCGRLSVDYKLKWNDYFCHKKNLYICEFPESNCATIANKFGNKCYEPSQDVAPYEEAREKCKERGGQLAIISSAEIDSFIRKTIYNARFWSTMTDEQLRKSYTDVDATFPWMSTAWIGMKYTDKEWKYEDGTTVKFSYWSDGSVNQPNSGHHCATLGRQTGDCRKLLNEGKAMHSDAEKEMCYKNSEKWNAVECEDKEIFFCQYPATEFAVGMRQRLEAAMANLDKKVSAIENHVAVALEEGAESSSQNSLRMDDINATLHSFKGALSESHHRCPWKAILEDKMATLGIEDGRLVSKFSWFVDELDSQIIQSQPFYTSIPGYRMRLYLYPKNNFSKHPYLGVRLLQGEFDSLLEWPFSQRYSYTILGKDDTMERIISQADPSQATLLHCYTSFQRPVLAANSQGCGAYLKDVSVINDISAEGFRITFKIYSTP